MPHSGGRRTRYQVFHYGMPHKPLARECQSNSHSSLQVSSAQLPKFHAAYSALLRQSMPGLRKRDKKKEKVKAEAAAARRIKLETDVVINGSKRGRGRAKRQRKVKAAIKQQETRKAIAERQQARSANKKV